MKHEIPQWATRAFAIVLTGICVGAAFAGPANPAITHVVQPDGTSFQAQMRGDEHQGWMETADGYTVIKNKKTGFFEYAAKGARGLVPSGIVVKPENTLQRLPPEQRPPKGLKPPSAARRSSKDPS